MSTEYEFGQISNITDVLLKHDLQNKHFVITGASGLIGKACNAYLKYLNEKYKLNIIVTLITTSHQKLCEPCYRSWDNFPEEFDFLIHAGAPTSSLLFKERPTEVFSDIVSKTRVCLEQQKKNPGSKGVFLSTLEIYGQSQNETLLEEDLGFIDIDNPRSSYPLGKRASEFLVKSYAKEFGIKASIARLTQTFGTGVRWEDPRVFAYFGRCCLMNEDIVLATPGKLKRAYLDVLDAVSGIFFILLNGEQGESYNVSNDSNYYSVVELAGLFITQNKRCQIKFNYDSEIAANFAPQIGTNLDISKLKGLGWVPNVNLAKTIEALLNSMQATRGDKND